MYHRVANDRFDPWGLAVSGENFDAQLAWLAKHRTVLPLDEFARLHRTRRLPRRAVALTFDDGYACNLTTAAPCLERRGLPATIFLPAELIERGREYWWDELAHAVMFFRGPAIELDGTRFLVPEARSDDGIWPPNSPPNTLRQIVFEQLWASLKTRMPTALDQAMATIRAQAGIGHEPRVSHRPLTPVEISSMRTSCITFGSHALTHPSLPALPLAERKREIRDSIARCAKLSGSEPRTFAYPYGDHDDATVQLVSDAGFDCACTTEHGFINRNSSAFALPRMQVGNWGAGRLAAMLAAR